MFLVFITIIDYHRLSNACIFLVALQVAHVEVCTRNKHMIKEGQTVFSLISSLKVKPYLDIDYGIKHRG